MVKSTKASPIWLTILLWMVVVIFIICIYDFFIYEPNLSNSTFSATSQYADVTFTTNSTADEMKIKVKYKTLDGVSAIHIHVNESGSPGPILAWLGTSLEWQNGVAQNVKGSNGNCCIDGNSCSLVAPLGTPIISNLANTTHTFIVKKPKSENCPWIKQGALLDVHGPNFQKKVNGQLTKERPGLDLISNSPFIRQ